MDAKEAERLLLQHGFIWIRSKGSHRIYQKETIRVVIPFHSGKSLHPKIVKEVLNAIAE
jgi:predicted RNA binding protein YcfA (HicA-like mRNA interferase family)